MSAGVRAILSGAYVLFPTTPTPIILRTGCFCPTMYANAECAVGGRCPVSDRLGLSRSQVGWRYIAITRVRPDVRSQSLPLAFPIYGHLSAPEPACGLTGPAAIVHPPSRNR